MDRLDARAVALRERLQALRYHQPLGLESAPLCEALLNDLEQSNQLLKAAREEVETHTHALLDAQKSVHPLRQENGRLLRETNKLHLALIEEREGSDVKQRESAATISKLQGRLSEAMFVSSQLSHRLRTYEADNQALRERIDEALQHNGVVLPSGVEVRASSLPRPCRSASPASQPRAMAGRPQAEWALPRILPQVRWHGRKEYMESLEPVAPVAAAAEAAARRPPEAEGAEARAAELVQAAEGQVTELRRRLEATSELLRAAESEAASSQQMVAAREAEAARLLETLGGEGTGGQAEGHALKQAEGREQQQQLDFLNQQVDFLNEWRSTLDAELRAERAARQAAEDLTLTLSLTLSPSLTLTLALALALALTPDPNQAAEERKEEAERTAQASGDQAAALQEALTKMLAKMEGQAEQAAREAALEQRYPHTAARASKGGRASSAMPARGAENKRVPRDATPMSSAASSRRAWLAETEVAVLRAKLDESRADATRAQRAEAAVVTLQRQLDQARVAARATQSRARPGATDAAAHPIPS